MMMYCHHMHWVVSRPKCGAVKHGNESTGARQLVSRGSQWAVELNAGTSMCVHRGIGRNPFCNGATAEQCVVCQVKNLELVNGSAKNRTFAS